jgi:hypothetical protein
MSFKTRERKRKRKAAQQSAQTKARRSGSSAHRWWLTPATNKCCCAVCGLVIREGGEVVYRHSPGETRCVRCAGRHEDSKAYRPSLRWERKRSKRQAA